MTRLAQLFVGGFTAAALALSATPIAQSDSHMSSPRFAAPAGGEVLPAGVITLLDQLTLLSAFATGSQNFEAAMDPFDDQAADDFVVPANESWNVDRVHAFGTYVNGAGPATSFHVTFFANDTNRPGVVECDYASAPFTSSLGDFAITLPGPCFLPNGTHWVSVQANMNSTDGQWKWGNRLVGTHSPAAWRNPGDGYNTGCTDWTARTTCVGGDLLSPDQAYLLVGTLGPAVTWTVAPLGAGSMGYPGASGSETGSLVRNGVASTCYAPKSNPGLNDVTPRAYDSFAVKNTSLGPECIQVTVNTACTGTNAIFPSAYLGTFNPASPATNWLADGGSSPNSTGSFSFLLPAGQTAVLVINEVTPSAGCASYNLKMTGSTARMSYDVNHELVTDRTLWRPSTGIWYSALATGTAAIVAWGIPTDIDVMGDYDGDGKADFAVWRPSIGAWFIIQSTDQSVRTDTWGAAGDIPMTGDYDGDGKADLIIYRPSAGAWFVKQSAGGTTTVAWGISGDMPLIGDYNGDGKADLVAYRPSSGVWYFSYSGGGTGYVGWGVQGDVPVQGNWDGDAKADPAVFRPSNSYWFVAQSSGGTLVTTWGDNGDVPVSGDLDADGKTDFNVFRNGLWYTQFTWGGTAYANWGIPGDNAQGRLPNSLGDRVSSIVER